MMGNDDEAYLLDINEQGCIIITIYHYDDFLEFIHKPKFLLRQEYYHNFERHKKNL